MTDSNFRWSFLNRRSLSPFLVGGVAVVLAFQAYLYRSGEDSRIKIHDGLDYVPAYTVMTKNDDWFFGQNGTVDPFLAGIPRDCLPSEFDLPMWAYRWFDLFTAIVVLETIGRLTVLVGLALLLSQYLIPRAPPWLAVGVAICASLVRIDTFEELSVAMLPLLAWALTSLFFGRGGWPHWLVVAVYPFVSVFPFTGFLIVPMVGAAALWASYRRKRVAWPLVAAVVVLTVGYAVSHYRLFRQLFFDSNYRSMRSEFSGVYDETTAELPGQILRIFLRGGLEAQSRHFPVVIAAAALALACAFIARRKTLFGRNAGGVGRRLRRLAADRLVRLLIAFLAVCALLAVWFGVFGWEATGVALDGIAPRSLKMLNLRRLIYFAPLCWAIVFALSLAILRRRIAWGGMLAAALIVLQGAMMVRSYEKMFPPRHLTFRQLYAEPLFEEVARAIGRDQKTYYVASLGMPPSVPLKNGFYCVDGFIQNYPLSHKHRMGAMMRAELAKNERLREYFASWGARCYLFSAELDMNEPLVRKDEDRKIRNFAVTAKDLKTVNVEYVISAVKVENAAEIGWRLLGTFERADFPWRVHLYDVRPSP